jgi:hypothetical protein
LTTASVVPGCTTSQFKCSDGPGCCDDWQHCTSVSGTGFCAAGNPTATGFTIVASPGSGGLSSGAKAGIAVGVVVGAGIIVGAITWFCLSQRRRRRTVAQQSGSGSGPAGSADGTAMTDVTSPSRPRQGAGMTQDYFGPDAVPGPFTESAGTEADKASPGPARAVPQRPQAPGDIAAPVEIDSTHRTGDSPRLSPTSPTSYLETPQSETIEGRFELYGSEAAP